MMTTLRPLLAALPKNAGQLEKVVARVARSLGGWLLGWAFDQYNDNPIFVSFFLFFIIYYFLFFIIIF